MANDLRHGIIGVEGRGSSHIRALGNVEGTELAAGADLVPEHVEGFENDHDKPGYTDHQEMLAEADLDSVSICTPNGTHGEIAIDCLEAGVNVFVEKPLEIYIDRVDAMIEAAEENDRKLGCVFQRRFDPNRWTARQWVEEGRFGDMILGDVAIKWHRPQSYYEDGWHGTRELDGGVLLQQAVHYVDMIQWLMGGVEEVSAVLGTLSHDMECEDTAVVNLRFENGALGCIEGTTSIKGGRDRIELNGTEGSFNNGTFVLDDEEVEPELEEPPAGSGFEGQMRDFFQAIREDRPPAVDGQEAAKSVELVMAAYASESLDRPVRIDEVRDLAEHT